MTSSSCHIYFHTPSGNQTKLWPVEKYWLWEFYNVRAFAVFDIFRLVLYCLLLIKSSATDLICFWSFNSKKLPSVKQEWITVCQVSKYADICLLISYLNTGLRIADKECHGNYVLISKEQHWRSPAKKLEE